MHRKLRIEDCSECPCLMNGTCRFDMKPDDTGCTVVIVRGGTRIVDQRKSAPPYVRSGRKYTPGEILPLVRGSPSHGGRNTKRVSLDGDEIGIASSRLATFRNSGLRCVCCGIEGSFFVKERHRRIKDPLAMPYHLNLYAIDGKGCEVLMTSDHIIPRSKVKNVRNNRQTMCTRCNHAKGSRKISIEALRTELFGLKEAVRITEELAEIELNEADLTEVRDAT